MCTVLARIWKAPIPIRYLRVQRAPSESLKAYRKLKPLLFRGIILMKHTRFHGRNIPRGFFTPEAANIHAQSPATPIFCTSLYMSSK